MPQRTGPGAPGILSYILTLNVGGSIAHRAAPSDGRIISFILCRSLASIPANVIIISHAITAKKCIGAIALLCVDDVSANSVLVCDVFSLCHLSSH